MRTLSPDVDSPDKLKNALSEQYGDLLPPTDKMEIGYFQSKNDSCIEEPASKQAKKKSSSNDKKAIVTDFEHKLQQKHDNYSPFQIKIWAESLASGQYSDLDTPGYAMFNREKEKKVSKDGNVEVVMSGMVNMMNSLCQALTPKATPSERKQVGLSPMKKAVT